MSDLISALSLQPPTTVPIEDQIAAVNKALRNAVDIRANVVGKTKEFAALADHYDRRIAGLSAALTTLRSVRP